MVRDQLLPRGISDPHVLAAMRAVPRHRFVPPDLVSRAYDDGPLPIGDGQTISQPYVVAVMTELAGAAPGQRALEVGAGSGYQAAVLAEIVDEVHAIELVPELAQAARKRLEELGVTGVQLRQGDGWNGWPEAAPFHVVLVACATDRVPPPLVEQLAPGRSPGDARRRARTAAPHRGGEAQRRYQRRADPRRRRLRSACSARRASASRSERGRRASAQGSLTLRSAARRVVDPHREEFPCAGERPLRAISAHR